MELVNENLEKKSNGKEQEEKKEVITPPELPEVSEAVLKIEELQKEVEKYKDLFLRKAAEFENYKRRIENEINNIIKFANESLIEELLPVLDDFERSLKHGRESADYKQLLEGIELIYQKFLKIFESQGVKSFETIGKPFDVEYHEAIMQVPRNDLPPNTVVDEIEKGYMMNNRVIRHAKVIVSSAPLNESGEQNKDTNQTVAEKKE